MITECGNDRSLIEQSCLLEGAKMDLLLKNFIKEGKDYKGLKSDLNEIIKANNMDDKQLTSKGKGFLHICKRILQILVDIDSMLLPVNTASNIAIGVRMAKDVNMAAAMFGATASVALAPVIIKAIITLIVNFIINRLLRLAIDAIEFSVIKSDAEEIVKELRKMAENTNDNKLKKKYDSEADRLEQSIEKYSKKKKD